MDCSVCVCESDRLELHYQILSNQKNGILRVIVQG